MREASLPREPRVQPQQRPAAAAAMKHNNAIGNPRRGTFADAKLKNIRESPLPRGARRRCCCCCAALLCTTWRLRIDEYFKTVRRTQQLFSHPPPLSPRPVPLRFYIGGAFISALRFLLSFHRRFRKVLPGFGFSITVREYTPSPDIHGILHAFFLWKKKITDGK